MGQNAVVCGGFAGVCVSFCRLVGCDWVVEADTWDIEGGVCVVGLGLGWVVRGCVCGERCLCLCAFGLERASAASRVGVVSVCGGQGE